MAVGDLVKSTLGPKGMDKILWGMGRNEGQVEVTNDGATILKAIGVDNPAAKVLVEMSKVQVCLNQLVILFKSLVSLNFLYFLKFITRACRKNLDCMFFYVLYKYF